MQDTDLGMVHRNEFRVGLWCANSKAGSGYPNQPKCSITANCNSDTLRVLVCQPWSYGLSPHFANTNTSFQYTLEGVAYVQDPEVDLYGSLYSRYNAIFLQSVLDTKICQGESRLSDSYQQNTQGLSSSRIK